MHTREWTIRWSTSTRMQLISANEYLNLHVLDIDLNDTIYVDTVRVLNRLFCAYAYRLTFCML